MKIQESEKNVTTTEVYCIDPFVCDNPEILILGSMPGEISLKAGFYYSDKRNRFWYLLSKVFKENIPTTIDEKKYFLNKHNIALWDVCHFCYREGSSDKTIKKTIPNNINIINAKRIFCNGATAYKLFSRFYPNKKATKLVSSSQAAGWKKEVDDLKGWEKIKELY